MESEKLKVVVLGGLEVWMFGCLGVGMFSSRRARRERRVFFVKVGMCHTEPGRSELEALGKNLG